MPVSVIRRIDPPPQPPQLQEVVEGGAEDALRIDSAGQGGAESRIERCCVAIANGVDNGVDGPDRIVADQYFDVLDFDPTGLSGIKTELFKLAPCHFAIIAEQAAQGVDRCRAGGDFGLAERRFDQSGQGAVIVGVAR